MLQGCPLFLAILHVLAMPHSIVTKTYKILHEYSMIVHDTQRKANLLKIFIFMLRYTHAFENFPCKMNFLLQCTH